MRVLFQISCAVVVALAVAASARAEDKFPWQPNLETAQQLAGQTNRLVLVHFWAPWCQPCMRLDKEVFSNAENAKALEANFVMVKLNVDEAPGTARLYGVSSLPTDLILSPSGRLVSQIQSPPTASQYVAQMNQAAIGHQELLRRSSQQAASAPPTAGDMASQANASAPAGTNMNTAQPAVGRSPYDPNQPYAAQPAGAPPVAGAAPAAQVPGAPPVNQPQYNARASYQPAPQVQLPQGCPPLGLDGYCPVTLVERPQWVLGDTHYGAIHRGRTYLFLGPAEQKKFLADPERYAPVLSGNDPVMALDNRTVSAGRREFGISYEHHVYLFADEASRQRFEQNPKRYSSEVLKAMK